MARQAEKQQAKSNLAKIALLRNLSIGANGLFILVRLIWCYKSTTKKTWFMYIITNIIACLVHAQLSAMGTPKFAVDGSLRSSGEDLSQAGLTEYLTDVVYLTWGIYVLVALITDYAWLLYLAIPGFALTMGWPLLQPLLARARQQAQEMQNGGSGSTGQGSAGEGEMSKRQAKMKAKQEKYSNVRMR